VIFYDSPYNVDTEVCTGSNILPEKKPEINTKDKHGMPQ